MKRRAWGVWGILYAITITYALIGLWHGACWNFVVWGLYHGFFLAIEQIGFLKYLKKQPVFLRIFYVNMVGFFGWPLFRSETLSYAVSYITTMCGLSQSLATDQYLGFYINMEGALALIAGIIFSFPIYPFIKQAKENILTKLKERTSILVKDISAVSNTATLTVILVASVSSIASGSYNPFIYFRF
jgi:alginate O-acetyltransferase complex protein AlgI